MTSRKISFYLKRFKTDPQWMTWLLALENQCFTEGQWTNKDFCHFIEEGGTIRMAFESNTGEPIAFILTDTEGTKAALHIVSIGVAASSRRMGLGRALVNSIVTGMLNSRRVVITSVVPLTDDTAAMKFFAANGFSSRLLKSPYEDNDEDAIVFSRNIMAERSNRVGHLYDGITSAW